MSILTRHRPSPRSPIVTTKEPEPLFGYFDPEHIQDPPEEYAHCGQCGEQIVLVGGRQVAYGCPCFDGAA